MAMPKQLRRLAEQNTRLEAKLDAIMANLGIDEDEVDYDAARDAWNARTAADFQLNTTVNLPPGTIISQIEVDEEGNEIKPDEGRANYTRAVGPNGEIIAAPADPPKDASTLTVTTTVPTDTITPPAEPLVAPATPPAPETPAKVLTPTKK